MKWMRERDALIAQTMAFVQSVTGKRPDVGQPVTESAGTPAAPMAAAPVVAAAFVPDIEAVLADTLVTRQTPVTREAPKPAQIVRPDIARPYLKGDFKSEIRDRVANFRAHQERFNREREAFGSATMAKVHASLREDDTPSRPGK
jgi:hypothetical protein